MLKREAEQAGYGSMVTSSRLVVRSPYNTPETYSEDVSGAHHSGLGGFLFAPVINDPVP